MLRPLHLVLAVIAFVAIALPAFLVHLASPPAVLRRAQRQHAHAPIAPIADLPPVEPVRLQDLTLDEARTFNAGVPFSTELNPSARPFRLADASADQARATDCLAAGIYYEAGDDAVGERAVAQVVINRLRHPAFPKTVCGVVFQGSEKTTGCQFTFTCDGSIDRRQPSDAAWDRARGIAAAALKGSVFRPVGWSTHYHTDFVVPYWQASLDKLAEIHTQLFYRWSGAWGTAPAFTGRPAASEPTIAALAAISDAHRSSDAADLVSEVLPTTPEPGRLSSAAAPAADTLAANGTFLVHLPAETPADGLLVLARTTCGDREHCRFLGWRDAHLTPFALPLSSAQASAMSFSFVRDPMIGPERAQWDCHDYPRHDARDCLKGTAAATPSSGPTATPAPVLDGVRRKDG